MVAVIESGGVEPARRLGIKDRLRAAFAAVAGMTVLAAGLAGAVQLSISQTIERISTERVPAMVALARVTEASNGLLAAAPGLGAGEDGVATQALAARVSAAEERFIGALAAIANDARLADQVGSGLGDVGELGSRISAQIALMLSAAEQGSRLGERRRAQAAQIDPLNQENRLLIGLFHEMDEQSWRYLVETNVFLLRLFDVAGRNDSGSLDLDETWFRAAIERLRRERPRVSDEVAERGLNQFIRRLDSLALRDDGLIALRRRELIALSVVAGRLDELRALTTELDRRVVALLDAAATAVETERLALERRLAAAGWGLAVATALALAIAGLVAWRYVGRTVVGRLERLAAATRAIAQGRLATPIPRDGADELTDMGAALAVFRDAVAEVSEARRAVGEAHERLRDAIDSISEGFALFDAEDRLILCNSKFESFLPRSFRFDGGDWTVQRLLDRMTATGHVVAEPDPGAWTVARLDHWRRPRGGFPMRLADGTWLVANDRRTEAGGTVTVLTDVTALKTRETLLNATLDNIDQGLAVVDRELRLMIANASFRRMLDLDADDVEQGATLDTIWRRLGLAGDAAAAERLRRTYRAGGWLARQETETPSGRRVEIRRKPMPDGGFVATYTDVTDQRRIQARIEHLATHDPLTGLANRTLFAQLIDAQLADPAARGAVLVADLGGFKDVNDTFGHDVGDAVLRVVAERLRAAMGDQAVLARAGGDRFLAMVKGAAVAWVLEQAEGVVATLRRAIEVDALRIDLAANVGIALFPRDGATAEETLRHADMALHAARGRGGEPVFFTPELGAAAGRRLAIRSELSGVIERGEISLVYQPKIDLRRSQTVGMEALVRWRHPERGLISPAQFIPIAEASGLIVELGAWILDQACRRTAALDAAGPPGLKVAVNVSPVQLLRSDLLGAVESALEGSGLAPERLEIEITEGVAMNDSPRVAAVLADLRALGVRLAIDDFGTGYSSLSYLKRLPVQTLKIDQIFVRDMAEKAEDARIVRAIIGIAHDFDLEIVAEGVETAAAAEMLRDDGCDLGQGYLFSKPLDPEGFAAFCAAEPWPAAR